MHIPTLTMVKVLSAEKLLNDVKEQADILKFLENYIEQEEQIRRILAREKSRIIMRNKYVKSDRKKTKECIYGYKLYYEHTFIDSFDHYKKLLKFVKDTYDIDLTLRMAERLCRPFKSEKAEQRAYDRNKIILERFKN